MATKRGNVLDPELTRLVQQVVRQFLNSFQPRPRAGKKRRGGGGSGGSSNLTKFAKVITQADANGDSIGTCVLLNADMQEDNPTSAVLASGDPGYDADAARAIVIDFKSADYVDHEIDDRVMLSCLGEITPGMEWEDDVDESKVWAHKVEYPTTAEELECETITVVTSVECVDGDIVVTDEEIEYVSGPCP